MNGTEIRSMLVKEIERNPEGVGLFTLIGEAWGMMNHTPEQIASLERLLRSMGLDIRFIPAEKPGNFTMMYRTEKGKICRQNVSFGNLD